MAAASRGRRKVRAGWRQDETGWSQRGVEGVVVVVLDRPASSDEARPLCGLKGIGRHVGDEVAIATPSDAAVGRECFAVHVDDGAEVAPVEETLEPARDAELIAYPLVLIGELDDVLGLPARPLNAPRRRVP